jgi:predicted flavoprotein YhiN
VPGCSGCARRACNFTCGIAGSGTARSDLAALRFATPAGEVSAKADAVVLALGGASWARLGSDGAWAPWLQAQRRGRGAAAARQLRLRRQRLDEHFSSRFAGQPFKSVAISFTDSQGRHFARKGEFVATATGIEGSLIYAASALLRDEIAANGSATLLLDLLPDRSAEQVLAAVTHPRGARSLSSHLKSRLGLEGIKAGVLHEVLSREAMRTRRSWPQRSRPCR